MVNQTSWRGDAPAHDVWSLPGITPGITSFAGVWAAPNDLLLIKCTSRGNEMPLQRLRYKGLWLPPETVVFSFPTFSSFLPPSFSVSLSPSFPLSISLLLIYESWLCVYTHMCEHACIQNGRRCHFRKFWDMLQVESRFFLKSLQQNFPIFKKIILHVYLSANIYIHHG